MIRAASLSDLQDILPLAHLMHSESPEFVGVPYNEHKVEASFRSWIENPGYIALVAGDGITRPLAGMLFATTGEYFFSDDRFSCDRLVYLHPDKRGGTLAMSMIRKYENWARRQGIKDRNICLGLSTGVNMYRNSAFLEAMGYRLTAHCFAKRGN